MYNRIFLLAFFLLLCQHDFLMSQSAADSIQVLLERSDYWQKEKKHSLRREKRREVNEALLSLDCQTGLLTDSLRALIFHRISTYYDHTGQAQQSLYYAEGSLEYARKQYGLNSIKNIVFLNELAQILEFYFENIESVLQIREEIERISISNLSENLLPLDKNVILFNLMLIGTACLKTDDESKFNASYAQIDQLLTTKAFKDLDNLFEYALFKSHGYLAFNRPEEAFQLIHPQVVKEDSLFKISPTNTFKLIISQTLLAEVYLAQNKPAKALALLKKTIDIQRRFEKKALLYEAYAIYVAAQALTTLGRYEESKNILDTIILKVESQGSAFNHSHLAELYEQLAKNQYLASMENSAKKPLYESYYNNQKALTHLKLLWGKTRDQRDLMYSLNYYYQVFESSLLTLHALYNQTDSLHYFEEALRLIELTKNVQLRSNIKQGAIAKDLGVSIHQLERERLFKEQIFSLKYKASHTEDSSLRSQFQDSIHELNTRLIKLQESIHRSYPNYTGWVHTQQGFTWAAMNEHLQKEKQTLLYFASGKEHLFLLGVSPGKYVFHKTAVKQDSFQQWINQIRESTYVSPSELKTSTLDEFIALSSQLYKILLEPIDSIATSRLLIIPDGALEILPFSMLLSKKIEKDTPISQWPFALRQYSISSAYALDLLLNPVTKSTHNFKEKILAFAPDFPSSLLRGDSTRYQGPLDNNKAEVAYINDWFLTKTFLGDQAKLSTFRETASDYAVLHLATHAVANTDLGDYSYLAFSETDFSDNQLNVGELYTMNIPAELVVLSACETGLGEWKRGEGVIGLERAFSYAGAQSLITTHWKVSDKASARLMSYFYDELARGLPKDQALQKAQLTFIDEQDSWLAHPFFWAAYVQKGNTDPLSIPKRSAQGIWWLLGVGMIGIVFVFIRQAGFN